LKRLFDFLLSLFGLIILLPLIILFSFLIWTQDFNNPFYIANRVGKHGKRFKMIKFRSMIINASSSGVDSTAADDNRITNIGKIVRKFKIDEIPQLLNVLSGDMSFVGPRPNVERETNLYSKVEQKILSVRPGITDFSSIVFSDEGDILEGSNDPDLKYNQIIRPWKSRLALLYIDNRTLIIDIKIIIWTIMGVFSKKNVLKNITNFLTRINSDKTLIEVCKREKEPIAYPPPGLDKIINKRL
jgi:lipopolysaccharide/colanic/teichoic acid biosynthesis glycosyltransferase